MNSNNAKQCSSNSKNGNDKKRLSRYQVEVLEASFYGNNKLEAERKLELAHELGVPPRQIAIWYQNKRARWKNQSMEQDYSSVSTQLETTLAQVRQLEQELHGLRVEMHKSQAEMSKLHATNYIPTNQQVEYYSASYNNYVQQPHDHHHYLQPPPPPDCDEGGSSSFHDDHDPMTNFSALISDHYDVDDDEKEDLIVDHELFAFFMGGTH